MVPEKLRRLNADTTLLGRVSNRQASSQHGGSRDSDRHDSGHKHAIESPRPTNRRDWRPESGDRVQISLIRADKRSDDAAHVSDNVHTVRDAHCSSDQESDDYGGKRWDEHWNGNSKAGHRVSELMNHQGNQGRA